MSNKVWVIVNGEYCGLVDAAYIYGVFTSKALAEEAMNKKKLPSFKKGDKYTLYVGTNPIHKIYTQKDVDNHTWNIIPSEAEILEIELNELIYKRLV